MPYDLFISYSRRDNAQGRVTELKERIEADYRTFAGEDLTCFFDRDDIYGMDDWRHRILDGLRQSSLLLLVLSPTYVASPYCEWEVIEYLKYEHSRAAQGQGLAPVYFVEIPAAPRDPDFPAREAAWLAQVRRRNRFDLRPWHADGAAALMRLDVRERLEDLERTLHERLSKLRRLAEAPGNLPAHNPRFVGRELEMQRLHESAGLGRFGVLTALQGMGGLGKTALAIQYACAYADFYPGGRWLLGCAGRTSLAGVLRELDVDLGLQLTEDERRDDRRAAKRILAELESRARQGAAARAGEPVPPEPRALLLLDNVDDPSLLQPPESDLLSGKRWLHVLATTRIAPDVLGHDPERQTLLTVDELPPEDALRLIESYQPGGRFPTAAERNAAAEIVRRLGGFTLAVEVVAVYLGECAGRVTCAALSQRLVDEGLEGVEGIAKSTKGGIRHVEKLLGATLGPTLDLLAPAEAQVLAYAALLPPDSIPLPWLRTLVGAEHPELTQDAAIGYPDPWLDLVNRLLGLRLLQLADTEPDTPAPRLVRMHRLLQDVVTSNHTPEAESRFGALCLHTWLRADRLSAFWHNPQQRWEIAPLSLFAQRLIDRGVPESHRFVLTLCQWLPNVDASLAPVDLLRRSYSLMTSSDSPSVTDEISVLKTLGWALRQRGQFEEAEDVLRQAISRCRSSSADHASELPTILNNLAKVLLHAGRPREALPILQEALELSQASDAMEEPTSATIINNLADALITIGDLTAAEELANQSLAMRQAYYKEEHPHIGVSHATLARLLLRSRRINEAEIHATAAIEQLARFFGQMHFRVADAIETYAEVLEEAGRIGDAIEKMRQVIAIRSEVLSPDHPDHARSAALLSRIASK